MKKILLALTLVFGLLSVAGTQVAAGGNVKDTTWTNVYRMWSPNDHTPARKKTNKTAYYNKTTKVSSKLGYINIWAALYDGRDVSAGHSYRSYQGSRIFLYNLAVEQRGSGIAVRINSKRYATGSASGVWSPDSVR